MVRILVIGDAILDRDAAGEWQDPYCASAQAPFGVELLGSRAGGAALAARLALESDSEVVLATAFSEDQEGKRLRQRIDPRLRVISVAQRAQTKSVIRVLTRGEMVLRIDSGRRGFPQLTSYDMAELELEAGRSDAVLVSDYGGGVAALPGVRGVLERCSAALPVLWDPHIQGASPIRGLDLVTPNRDEALTLSPIAHSIESALFALRDRWEASSVVCTDGAAGALAITDDGTPWRVEPPVASDGDTCGAGDKFVAALTVCRARGVDRRTAIKSAVIETSSWLSSGGVSLLTTWEDAYCGRSLKWSG